MGNLVFCVCENKGADQLRSNCTADQRLCFRYTDSTMPLITLVRYFKLLAFFCDCIGYLMSDLVVNPEYRLSRGAVHIIFHLFKDL